VWSISELTAAKLKYFAAGLTLAGAIWCFAHAWSVGWAQ
jgi:hypothetical protein